MPLSPPRSDPASDMASAPGVETREGSRGRALIVDDDPTNRRLLSLMLKGEGFDTLEAGSGEDALSLFEIERSDIVFMDVMLPGIDGFETTRAIKHMAGMDFVPVIFLTALRDEESLMRCTQAGGDDFLVKPFSINMLKTRILAMERVRDLQRNIAAKQLALSYLLEQDREEQALAERVLSQAVRSRNLTISQLGVVQRPAVIFSGDLVLTQHLPEGGLRVLVADFTGHGLAATIGSLPVADAFHAMTRKGLDDAHLLAEINRKLHRLLPTERFMAACLVSISPRGDELRWWNGGMPSAWLRTAEGLRELSSHALPLGILAELHEQASPRRIRIRPGDRLLLMSDGLLEARDAAGSMFAQAGFQEVLADWAHGTPILPALFAAFDAHCGGNEQSDDVAVVEVPLDLCWRDAWEGELEPSPQGGWSWSLELEGDRLARRLSIATALKPLGLFDGMTQHLGAIETIVGELYDNAVEHGILRLDSSMKATPDGFDAYYRERARRLAGKPSGRVRLHLAYEPQARGGCVRLHITDSGDGFDPNRIMAVADDTPSAWGWGIPLVRELCESVTYRAQGSQVEAVYRW